MRPIETVYKGYRFRSRLEARWAVFFDALGVRWEYEKEGFELGDGIRYLPDFWLPREQLWIEIKPESGGWDGLEKCRRLTQHSGHSAMMIQGSPWAGEYSGALFTRWDEEFKSAQSVSCLARCRKCDALNWLHYPAGGGHWAAWGSFAGCCDTERSPVPDMDELLQGAYRAARTARFEHGESPFNGPGRWKPM